MSHITVTMEQQDLCSPLCCHQDKQSMSNIPWLYDTITLSFFPIILFLFPQLSSPKILHIHANLPGEDPIQEDTIEKYAENLKILAEKDIKRDKTVRGPKIATNKTYFIKPNFK